MPLRIVPPHSRRAGRQSARSLRRQLTAASAEMPAARLSVYTLPGAVVVHLDVQDGMDLEERHARLAELLWVLLVKHQPAADADVLAGQAGERGIVPAGPHGAHARRHLDDHGLVLAIARIDRQPDVEVGVPHVVPGARFLSLLPHAQTLPGRP